MRSEASGWLDFIANNPHNTNLLYLLDPRYAQVGPYLQSPGVYHCPADRSRASHGGHPLSRVRSVSANMWMNYVGNVAVGQDKYVIFRKTLDYPASYHNRAAGLSFTDGHAEVKRWLDARTTPLLSKGQLIPLNVVSPNNPDVAWLQERSSVPK